jgi:hypothetical protein
VEEDERKSRTCGAAMIACHAFSVKSACEIRFCARTASDRWPSRGHTCSLCPAAQAGLLAKDADLNAKEGPPSTAWRAQTDTLR